MNLQYYDFTTKSPNSSVMATKEAYYVQEELGVKGDSLAAVKVTTEEV